MNIGSCCSPSFSIYSSGYVSQPLQLDGQRGPSPGRGGCSKGAWNARWMVFSRQPRYSKTRMTLEAKVTSRGTPPEGFHATSCYPGLSTVKIFTCSATAIISLTNAHILTVMITHILHEIIVSVFQKRRLSQQLPVFSILRQICVQNWILPHNSSYQSQLWVT